MKLKTRLKLLDTYNFVSLTDIVMLLVIFFLLSSTFIVQPGIKVRLPQTDTSEEIIGKSITVTIAKGDQYYLNDELLPFTDLGARLNSLMKTQPTDIVIIKADKTIELGRVVAVMDICKKVGFTKFNLATEPISG
jgi:biopolymer transport protein ExbD